MRLALPASERERIEIHARFTRPQCLRIEPLDRTFALDAGDAGNRFFSYAFSETFTRRGENRSFEIGRQRRRPSAEMRRR